MKNHKPFKFSFWKVTSIIVLLVGTAALFIRFTKGLGYTTHLSDMIPWGLWIGLDFIGVGISAAGFTIAAAAHIFNDRKYEQIARSAILTAYIGYILVVLLLIIDLGKPENFWHPLIMWNPHSVMFEITWCVICYSTILTLELSPVIFEKFKLSFPLKLVKKITLPVVILGVLFSTLHQSSFGSLYLIVPGKVYPLWYSSLLPIHFFITCIAAGLSMIIFESYMCARSFNRGLNLHLISSLGKGIFIVLFIEFILKFADLALSSKFGYLFMNRPETYFFWIEVLIGIIIPLYMLSSPRFNNNRMGLYFISIFTLSGFVLNRMNVSVTSLVRYSGESYRPSFGEIAITLFLVALGAVAFNLIVKYFPVFEKQQPVEQDARIKLVHEAKTINGGEIICSK